MRHYISARPFKCRLKLKKSYLYLICKSVAAALDTCAVDTCCEVNVFYTSLSEIRHLNNRHRNVDSETDVLSFPQLELSPGDRLPASVENFGDYRAVSLGDIVISPERAFEQAERFGHAPERELSYLAVHATLHLLGYDHETEADDNIMRAKATAAMSVLGLENAFEK